MGKKKVEEDFSAYSLLDLVKRIAAIDWALRYPDHGLSRWELRRIEERRRKLCAATAPHIARIRIDVSDEEQEKPTEPQ